MKKLLSLTLTFLLVFEIIYPVLFIGTGFAASWQTDKKTPYEGSMKIGTINKYKAVVNSTPVYIDDPQPYNVAKVDVYIDGGYEGQALGYSWSGSNTNNGYIYIHVDELEKWVEAFGGNLDFVHRWANKYRKTITYDNSKSI